MAQSYNHVVMSAFLEHEPQRGSARAFSPIGFWPLWLVGFQCALLAILSIGKYSGLEGPLPAALAMVTWFPSALKSVAMALLFTGAMMFARQGWREAVNRVRLYRAPTIIFVANIALFVILMGWLVLTPPLRDSAASLQDVQTILYVISPVVWLGFGAASALALWSPKSIAGAMTPLNGAVFAALSVAMFAYFYVGLPLGKTQTDALVALTMRLAAPLYSLMGGVVTFAGYDVEGHPVYTADGFSVSIAPSCAGAQGMILATLIAVLFIALESKRLRLPRALALALMLAGLMFLINAARIAILLYIGAHWSAEIAITGFHSNFGVVSLAFVSILLMAVLQLAPAFRRAEPSVNKDKTSTANHRTIRLVAPLTVLISASLLTSLVSGSFYWLYPVHAFAAAVALWWARETFIGQLKDVSPVAILAGAGAFLLWVGMVPPDDRQSAAFAASLFGVSAWLSVVWLVFRVIGSVIIVPIAEELAFRSVLQDALNRSFQPYVAQRLASAGAVLASALVFALVHSNFAAALVAGLVYGLVYIHRGRVGDAIIAHGTTNLLIAVYVLMLGHWSYW